MTKLTVQLSNRLAKIEEPESSALSEALKEAFSFRPEKYFFHPKYRLGIWDGRIRLLKNGTIPSGLFLAMRENIERDHKIRFQVKDQRIGPAFHPFPDSYAIPGFEVRPFQRECVKAMIEASGTGGLVLNATGTGKTFIAGLFFRLLQGPAVFCVDELTLLEQAREEIAKVAGEDVGRIGESRFEPARLTVATIQTIHKHRQRKEFKAWAKHLQVLILDEVHMMLNKRSAETIRAFKPPACYGLTATLQLEKESIFVQAASLCGPKLFEYNYQQGKQERFLTPGVCIGVDVVREIKGSSETLMYAEDYRHWIAKSKARNQLIEDLAREALDRGKRVAILVERPFHLRILQKRLRDIPLRVAYGAIPKAERIQAKHDFDSGKVRLLLANRVFKKGVNLKQLDCIIDAASMASEDDTRQKFGRGVRLASAKDGLLYFDIGDKKPEGLDNRFAAATNKRRRSLSRMGIPTLRLESTLGAAVLMDKAEALLKKHLQLFKQTL